MDLQHEIASLLNSGLRFRLEIHGNDAVERVGDYLRQHALTEMVGTLDDAMEWLGRQRDAAMA